MKAWVLQMMIVGAHSPPSVMYFDTHAQCDHELGAWTVRTIETHPDEIALLKELYLEGSSTGYRVILVGRYFATCLPTDELTHQPWENTSP